MIKSGDYLVVDPETGEDITRIPTAQQKLAASAGGSFISMSAIGP
jgi:hypothetical protein